MKLDELYPSTWMKAADLAQPILANISGVKMEDIGDEGEKPVLYFNGEYKAVVLNRTNASTIAELYGDDTNAWIGKNIVLFKARVDFRGKMVDAIRVRAPRQPPSVNPNRQIRHDTPQRPPAPVEPPAEEDDVPF